MRLLFADLQPFSALLVIVTVLIVLALILILSSSISGRRVVAFLDSILRDWACLIPLLAFCSVICVEYAFDVRFLQEPSVSRERPEFTWVTPAINNEAATRVEIALYALEMVYVALTAAVFVAIARCLVVIYAVWSLTAWRHRLALFVTVAIVAEVNYVLWFTFNPLERVLSNTLSREADAILGLDEPLSALTLAALCAIWLTAMTSGFIVAREVSDSRAVQEQLDQLTVLLYLAAAVLILFMFVLGASLFAAASLLGQGERGPGGVVRQLALVEALNFGVFWSLFLAAIHYPSVWAVTRKPCTDRLENKESPSPTRYYGKVATALSIFSPFIVALLTKIVESFMKW